MIKKTVKNILSILGVFIFSVSTGWSTPITVFDQVNASGGAIGGNSSTVSIGQTFTPTLTGIDAIEFNLGTQATALNAFVNLRDLSAGLNFNGNILGVSSIVSVTNLGSLLTYHFDFASTIALTPGVAVVAEIIFDQRWLAEGDLLNPYAGGVLIEVGAAPGGGVPSSHIDLVFSEGLHSVPEPTTLALMGLGFAGIGWKRRKAA